MTFKSLAPSLPHPIAATLFGDRERFGRLPDPNDRHWIEWGTRSVDFYHASQKGGPGAVVNHAGYKVMRDVDLTGKTVLEIGPASLDHIAYWKGAPAHFTGVDINPAYLGMARAKLEERNVPFTTKLVDPLLNEPLPFDDASFDIILTFYSLEHIYYLENYLSELRRVLRPGGVLAGAIPCEGGLAWGAGRYLTTRRWLLNNTTIDPNRIICWEHPNFADTILNELSRVFRTPAISFWPLRIPAIDINLVAKFVCTR
jgi:SAM-dependent methyltransferase